MHGALRRGLAASVVAAVAALSLAVLTPSASYAAGPTHPFPTHVAYKVGVMPSASQSTRDTAVEHAYDAWKSTYLVHGCASNEYYVSTKGDGDATNNGPVSEGQGYGMNIVPLMAGYDANAQTEFNGLWQLVKDHEDQYGLMQWQLDGKTCKYYSSGTPDGATDGDLDIGYGLILADTQWGGYTNDAKTWLAAFYAHDVASDGHLKCEDDGPSTDTRPSDDMLDHLRAFAAYDTAHDWAKVVNRMQAITTEFTSAYSPSADLLSDFVVNATTTSPKPAPANYQEDQPDNIVGYNSIRVPWHMGTDALEYGSSVAAVSYGVAQKESACLKGLAGGDPAKVQPHIKLNCANGNVSGDTQAEEAGDPVGPAAMASGDQAWTDAIWGQLATNPFGDGYYGETIKMLVYIVMAGDWWNPATASAPANDFSISASPASGSVTQGGSVSTTISTAVTSGSAQTVTLAATGGPTGSTVTLTPASVTAGASSTLTVATTGSTTTGTFTITVTGTAASGTHTTTYAVTVNPASSGCTPTQLLTNPGFESGTTGWIESSTLGNNPITNLTSGEPPHSGTWEAWLNGNGSADTDGVGQIITIPTGCTTTLTYWLHIDTTESTSTATDDTLKVQLLTTSGTVVGTLASFSNLTPISGYQQKTADLTAYAGQTLKVKFTGKETDAHGGTTDFVVDDTAVTTSAP